MEKHLKLGKEGENIANEFLEKLGYKILERNWRNSHAEVDIICNNQDGILVFVEVKTRSGVKAIAELDVTLRKQRLLTQAAFAYMESVDYDWECRFDVVSVYKCGSRWEISHLEDAFFLGLN